MRHPRQIAGPIADMAREFAERWGMVAAIDDGEDSSGRHKLRLATADEVVNRANAIAEKLWDSWAEKGWIHDVPSLEELDSQLQKTDNQ